MPVAVTHFKITELFDSNAITSLIDGNPIVIDQLYPIAEQSLLTFERNSIFDNKAVKSYFKYKLIDNVNNIESNEALGRVEWEGPTPTPTSSNITQLINNMETKNLLDILPLNDSVEFIRIVSLEGVQALTVSGLSAFVGQDISIVELAYTNYTSLNEGGGLPYFKMTYQVGKGLTVEPTVYELIFNINAAGELDHVSTNLETYSEDIDESGIITTYTVHEERIELEVTNGQANGTAQVQFIINSAFLSLHANNIVEVAYGNDQFERSSNDTVVVDIDLDAEGKAIISITNYAVDTGAAIIGSITVTLQSINNNGSLVNGSQIVTINSNL